MENVNFTTTLRGIVLAIPKLIKLRRYDDVKSLLFQLIKVKFNGKNEFISPLLGYFRFRVAKISLTSDSRIPSLSDDEVRQIYQLKP